MFGRKEIASDEALDKALKELRLREALVVGFQRQVSGLGGYIAEVEDFVAGKPPWALMPQSDMQDFTALFKRGRTEFADLARYRTPHGIDELATDTLLAMMTGDERAFSTMPKPIRDLINSRYRLPTDHWHQMFGLGADIQGNALLENEGSHLLLQLVYDDMVGWRFGDMGAFQFWISPADLAARNWVGAKLTFECH